MVRRCFCHAWAFSRSIRSIQEERSMQMILWKTKTKTNRLPSVSARLPPGPAGSCASSRWRARRRPCAACRCRAATPLIRLAAPGRCLSRHSGWGVAHVAEGARPLTTWAKAQMPSLHLRDVGYTAGTGRNESVERSASKVEDERTERLHTERLRTFFALRILRSGRWDVPRSFSSPGQPDVRDMLDLRGKSGRFGRYFSRCPEADEADCDIRRRRQRRTGVYQGRDSRDPRSGREALRSWDGGPSGVLEHSSPAPGSIWGSERGKGHGENRTAPTDRVEHEHNHFPRALRLVQLLRLPLAAPDRGYPWNRMREAVRRRESNYPCEK
ncbi:hypothetical protein EDB89DRAFT_301430 [Lactarius sanguifluus]|nr:hypothetical protein EDB89DRAFT_301430 [Lactarius sanguifluus]